MPPVTCSARPSALSGSTSLELWWLWQAPPPPPPPAPPPTAGGRDTTTPACAPNDPAWAQTLGPGAVTSYDAWRRSQYTTAIGQNSQAALNTIDLAEAAGDRGAAWRAAQDASDTRNAIRTASQDRLSWGGRLMSDRLEGDRSWDYITRRYDPDGLQDFNAARNIASASGRSAKLMTYFSRFSRVAGPVGVVFGGAVAVNTVAQACPQDRPRVAAAEGGGMVVGAAGAVGGTVVAVLLLGSNPVGWAVLAAGVVGAGIGGFAGSEGGRWLGGAVYDFFAR